MKVHMYAFLRIRYSVLCFSHSRKEFRCKVQTAALCDRYQELQS